MDHTLLYLVDRVFPSPFDFFQAFGDYWEERGWQKIGHQLEDLFSRLWSFLSEKVAGSPDMDHRFDADTALGLMKYDYFLNHNYKPRKIWWDFTMDKQELNSWMRQLAERPNEVSGGFRALGAGEKELHKHAVIEKLPFDLEAYLASGTIRKEADTLLVMYYQQDDGKSVQAYTLRLEKDAARILA
jgi:anaerobic magnesium-protoporphyrin IX monomethyl ester cyclase